MIYVFVCAACAALPWRLITLTANTSSPPNLPSHTKKQVNKIAADVALDWSLQPGDVQLLSDHTNFHMRLAWTDSPVRLMMPCGDGFPSARVAPSRQPHHHCRTDTLISDFFCLPQNHTYTTKLSKQKKDPALKRHLLRLWVAPPDDRPLDVSFNVFWGGNVPGARGGIRAADRRPLTLPLVAELGQAL